MNLNRLLALVLLGLLVPLLIFGTVLFLSGDRRPRQLAFALIRDTRDQDCGFGDWLTAEWSVHFGIQPSPNVWWRQVASSSECLDLWVTSAGLFYAPQGQAGSVAAAVVEASRESKIVDVRQGDVVLDCGANVGFRTRSLLDQEVRKVVAIKTDPINVECLRRTFLSEIGRGAVVVEAVALWDRPGEMDFLSTPGNRQFGSLAIGMGQSDGNPERSIRVRVTTIDEIVSRLALDRLDYIKMDIEGAEVPALRGAVTTLRRFRPRLQIAANHQLGDPAAIRAAVRAIVPNYSVSFRGCTATLTPSHFAPEAAIAHWAGGPRIARGCWPIQYPNSPGVDSLRLIREILDSLRLLAERTPEMGSRGKGYW